MASTLPPSDEVESLSLCEAAETSRRRVLDLLERCKKLRAGNEASEGSWVEWVPALVAAPWVGSAGATTVARSASAVAQILYSLDAATLMDPRCLGVSEIASVEDGIQRHSIRKYRFRYECLPI